jgi:hypothetical protein
MEVFMDDLKCEVCGQPALGVCSSAFGAISHAYCRECLTAGREVWSTLVGGLVGVGGPDDVVEEVKPRIAATCAFYKKTEARLWQEIDQLMKDYDAYWMQQPKEAP